MSRNQKLFLGLVIGSLVFTMIYFYLVEEIEPVPVYKTTCDVGHAKFLIENLVFILWTHFYQSNQISTYFFIIFFI
jgi:hypothetical protein